MNHKNVKERYENFLKYNNKVKRGGESSMLGNNFQEKVYKALLMRDLEFSFSAQHINEDIEFHFGKKAELIQVKGRIMSGTEIKILDVFNWITSYLNKIDYLNFYLNNESYISKWIFVFNKSILGFEKIRDIKKELKKLADNKFKKSKITEKEYEFILIVIKKLSVVIMDKIGTEKKLIEVLKNSKFKKNNKIKPSELYKVKDALTDWIYANLRTTLEEEYEWGAFEDLQENEVLYDLNHFELRNYVLNYDKNFLSPEAQQVYDQLLEEYPYFRAIWIIKNWKKSTEWDAIKKMNKFHDKHIQEIKGSECILKK